MDMDDERAREIKKRYSTQLMSIAGVQGVGIGPGPVLLVFTDRDVTELGAPLPAELEGLSVKVVRSEPFQPQSARS